MPTEINTPLWAEMFLSLFPAEERLEIIDSAVSESAVLENRLIYDSQGKKMARIAYNRLALMFPDYLDGIEETDEEMRARLLKATFTPELIEEYLKGQPEIERITLGLSDVDPAKLEEQIVDRIKENVPALVKELAHWSRSRERVGTLKFFDSSKVLRPEEAAYFVAHHSYDAVQEAFKSLNGEK